MASPKDPVAADKVRPCLDAESNDAPDAQSGPAGNPAPVPGAQPAPNGQLDPTVTPTAEREYGPAHVEQLYQRIQQCRRILLWKARAYGFESMIDDLLQEIRVRLLRHTSIEWDQVFSLIVRIGSNILIDWKKTVARRKTGPFAEGAEVHVRGSEIEPLEQLIQKEEEAHQTAVRRKVKAFVESLPDRDLLMAFFRGELGQLAHQQVGQRSVIEGRITGEDGRKVYQKLYQKAYQSLRQRVGKMLKKLRSLCGDVPD